MARARRSRARRRQPVGPHGRRGGALPRLWRGLVLGRAGPSGRRGGRVAADRADPRRARRCGGGRRRIPLRGGGHRQPLGLRDPEGRAVLAPAWRVLGWAGILLLVLAPFVALAAGRTERLPAKRGLEVAGFTAMGLSSLLIVFALAGDVLHVRAWLGVGGSQLTVVGGAMVVLLIGLWRARRPATVRVVAVPITGLPSDLEGFRIAQLSDLHVGPTLKRDFVEPVVDTTNGLQPDLIALTGDVADGFPPALRAEVAPLAGLEAPHGKYFVTGNHEYYWDAAGWVRELEGLGFRALINGHQVIRRGTGRIVLAGVTDLSSGGLPGHVSDPAAAV